MSEVAQLGETVQVSAFYKLSNAGVTGLSPTANIISGAGALIQETLPLSALNATKAPGVYVGTVTSPIVSANGYFAYCDAGTNSVDDRYQLGLVNIGQEWIQEIARLSDGVIIRVGTPGYQNNDITIINGDTYVVSGVIGGVLRWVNDGSGVWPTDLTGGTITFKAFKRGGARFSKAGSIFVATGADQEVRCELTTAESESIAETQTYQLLFTLSGQKRTLASGKLYNQILPNLS